MVDSRGIVYPIGSLYHFYTIQAKSSLPWVGGENPTIRSLIFASARKRRPLNIPTNLNSK